MVINKLAFGISKLHYALRTDEDYAVPKALPGAVKIALNAKYDELIRDPLNAVWPVLDSSHFYGYDGSVTIANLTPDFCVDVLGYELSSKGLIERSTYYRPECALLFEVDGSVPERHCYYSCFFGRPDFNGETKTNSINAATVQIPVIVRPQKDIDEEIPHDDGDIRLINSDVTSAIYKNWFKAVP